MTELWSLSAGTLASMIRTGEVSSREVIDAHLARIDAVNPSLNAIVRVLADEAVADADLADRRRRSGAPLGPLHGVPFTIKENLDMAGLPTTEGVPALAQAIAPVDAPVVERMKATGAIPIGRTNLPDFALRVQTSSSLHGLTRNPWRYDITAGGSSGGEGSALAAGLSPIGLGNDIGGSLRNPANVCGIASIKPSTHRVPTAGVVPVEDSFLAGQLMAVDGPMARRVADVRLGLSILMGHHPRDPFSISAPLEGAPVPHPIRVAVVPEVPGSTSDPAVAAGVRRAADALAAAGYAVDEVVPPNCDEIAQVWLAWLVTELRGQMPVIGPIMGDDGRRFLDLGFTVVAEYDLAGHGALLTRRQALARSWSTFMADYPLVLGPTWTRPLLTHDWDIESAENAIATLDTLRPVVIANLLGLPSACVPAGLDPASGLPIGVLVNGRRFREDLCLDAAEAIEAALGVPTPIDPAW